MERSLRAQDELDGLPFKTMDRLEASVTAYEHPELVGQPSVVARMENPGDPSQRGADVPCLFPKFTSGAGFQGFVRLAVASGKHPKPGGVQSGFVVPQLQQRGVVVAQQNHAANRPNLVGWIRPVHEEPEPP